MAKSDDKDEEEVNFLDIQKNLKTYSQKELRALENVLIDAYHGVLKEKDGLVYELNEFEVEKNSTVDRLAKLNEEVKKASKENSLLNYKLKKCSESESKGKKSCREIPIEL
ncbi:hypothetical protein HAX54_023619 [Datura stramonium]|uniref:Uncharacterized protein n=1 Tax=Datura stramonium TaxID=4076 RepID=A0ABS8S4Y5_DATST|nr:hypothetical protein [Datura stramonium]